MKERIGEDPGRFLDRPLYDHGVYRLEKKPNAGWKGGNQTLTRDTDVSSPGSLIRDRIRGIDHVETARAWQAVERSLSRTPEGGRDEVIGLLEDRVAELEDEGERPDLLATPEEDRPERYRVSVRERPATPFFWVAPDGERRPWSERPTSFRPTRDDSSLFGDSESDENALADGGERQ